MIQITSTLDTHNLPIRPMARKRTHQYVPPPPPMMRMYKVEIRQGADTTKTIPWWGPINDDDIPVMFAEMELKHGLLAVQCWW